MEMVINCYKCGRKFGWDNSIQKKDLNKEISYICSNCFNKDKELLLNEIMVWNCPSCKKDSLIIHEH